MNEYLIENGKKVSWKKLNTGLMSKKDYSLAHQYLVIACHDIIIEYHGGILLVVRDNLPAKDQLWPIGGRILRGMSIIDSLKKKVKEECNLEVTDIKELGWGRTGFNTDPFNHGKGTDTISIMYYGKGTGQLRLNKLHKNPTIIKKSEYTPKLRATLHPYVREMIDKALSYIK